MDKTCSRCGESKPPIEFLPRRRYCRKCGSEITALWTQKNHQRSNEAKKRWAQRNPDFVRACAAEWARKRRAASGTEGNIADAKAQRTYRSKMRKLAIEHYGSKCQCCGESTYQFLAIDHINNDGYVHRQQGIRGSSIYLWLRKHGYPDGFRVLCHNCNLARGFYGTCPHGNC